MSQLSPVQVARIITDHNKWKWMKTIAREYWHSIHTVRKYVRMNKPVQYVEKYVDLSEENREDVDTTIFMIGIWLLITVPLLILYFIINV